MEEGDSEAGEVKTRCFSGLRRVSLDFDDFLPVSLLPRLLGPRFGTFASVSEGA
jgi:hypothetical protein